MPLSPDIDWHDVAPRNDAAPAADARGRLRWMLGFYAAAFAIVLLRAVQLELREGAAFRAWAARPAETLVELPAPRGRIVARDGTVLAADEPALALAMHYRYLETPSDPRWLRRLARLRLARAERRDPQRVAAAERRVREELADLHHRLAALCKLSDAEWRARTARISGRVAALAEKVNRRRLERFNERTSAESDDAPLGVTAILAGLFAPPQRLPPAEVIVAEQTAFHRLLDDLPGKAAETIRSHPDAFPGVTIAEYTRRRYPQGTLAANVVGHVSAGGEDGAAAHGEMGWERLAEATLAGTPGMAREFADRRGKLLARTVERPPAAGRDVVLTLDPQLQRFAEGLLDRRAARDDRDAEVAARGAAIVVMDVHSGEMLTAACEPRFDPNLFAAGDDRLARVLADRRQPLFDRATKMAIAPGSVFKPLAALALLEHGIVDAHETFDCRGYLHDPDHLRCQIFRALGVGHGDVTLAGALARSCNVYFFHHARELGGARLVDWARRFGFAGPLPEMAELEHESQLAMFAVGQGAFAATPLEVARMYAAIANGGYLVEPRFSRAAADRAVSGQEPLSQPPAEARIAGLDAASLNAVRAGLRRVVDDPSGTAYEALRGVDVPLAGKTGTAETGGRRPDHAWFAGYVPADVPRFAFVVALEHGGGGAAAAALAAGLVQRMQQLGYLPRALTAEKKSPPE